jgi:Cu(I)/Ag(I) efflux system membrane protein CusA/SilA
MVFLFILFAVGAGVWCMLNVPLDAIPDLTDVQVIIFTEWPGRDPNLVEDQVTYPIVSAMLAAPRAKVVRGLSFFGISFVYVLFDDGTDIYWARSRILEYLNAIQGQLPPDARPQLGPDATGLGWGFEYALVDETGENDLQQLRSFQDWYLRYWLTSVDGVSEVASVGGFEKQYQVDLDPNRLVAYGLPIKAVIGAIRRSNQDVGGRTLELGGKEFFVRGRGYIKSVGDLDQVVVGTDGRGTPILLRDVANVHLGPDMRRGIAELNGRGEVVGGIVVVRFGENVLKVIDRVKDKIEEIRPSLPDGVEIVTTYDRSDLILRSIDTLKRTLIEEAIIVSVVIIFFLLHFRSALVAVIALPIAVILSFIPMYLLGVTSNIMSLGGIAIAIGAMVDAQVVLIENAHKRLEQAPPDADRTTVLIEAAKEVGKPLFFSLLIITVSFLPVFSLQAQEGRLFKPLAYTKTFSMFFASIMSISLVPALMVLFIRGRIVPEHEHPISIRLQRVYHPWMRALMQRRGLSIAIAAIVVVSCAPLVLDVPVLSRFIPKLGSEFMPPLNEGDILFMPTSPPGISITEAGKALQIQDKIMANKELFPEVKLVFGKVGRALTSTDPAPLSMVETNVLLHPPDQWSTVERHRWYSSWAPEPVKRVLRRIWPDERHVTWDELEHRLEQYAKLPAWTSEWTMPIKARIDMLSTGIKSEVGIKITGDDATTIQNIGMRIEAILPAVEGTRSVYADRVTGGYFIDFTPRREVIARYGLNVEDVEQIVQTAIGGMNIDVTVEGRERYHINVRYARELRDDLVKLSRVLVPTPMGAHVPIGQLANIEVSTGAPFVRNENGERAGWVFIGVEGRDVGSYVEAAKQKLIDELYPTMPDGYHLEWTGQYEFMQRMKKRLRVVIPVTLAIVVVMLYMNFGNVAQTLIVLLSVPFALTGSLWALKWAHYNMSVAVAVGMIALAGVAAETGIVMIVYLDEAFERYRREGRMRTQHDLFEAITEGAVQRIRPKLMTVTTTIAGLLPIMLHHGAGADVMQRIALPMIGGLITSTILTLEIVPAIYSLWRQRWITWVDQEPAEKETP